MDPDKGEGLLERFIADWAERRSFSIIHSARGQQANAICILALRQAGIAFLICITLRPGVESRG